MAHNTKQKMENKEEKETVATVKEIVEFCIKCIEKHKDEIKAKQRNGDKVQNNLSGIFNITNADEKDLLNRICNKNKGKIFHLLLCKF